MRYQGRSMLSGMAEAIAGLAKGRNRREMAEIDGMLGVTFDSLRGEVTARFSAHDDLPGRMARAQPLFFKFNGLSWWRSEEHTFELQSLMRTSSVVFCLKKKNIHKHYYNKL